MNTLSVDVNNPLQPLQERLFILILAFWQCRQFFVHYLVPILLTCKVARGYIYQVASGEYPFAENCSEKEQTRKTFYSKE